jgi:serine/threonine protein kinase
MEGEVDFDSRYWSHVSPAAKELINGLLDKNPKKRYTAETALQHPWIQEKDEELDQHSLNSGLVELRKHLIRRKLRAVLTTVLLTQRLKRLSFLTKRSSSRRDDE